MEKVKEEEYINFKKNLAIAKHLLSNVDQEDVVIVNIFV
jgi:hypothetical protein